MSAARATFDRVTDARDEIRVVRADGSTVAWSCPTYGGTIPHDLVHVVVESEFGLERGLWGSILGGLDMAGVRERGRSSDGAELMTAEALATVNWYDDALDGSQRCEAVLEACEALRALPPMALDPPTCERATAALKRLKAWCRALALVGGESRFGADQVFVGGVEVCVRMCARA